MSGGSGSGIVPLACPRSWSAISVISVAVPSISTHVGSSEPWQLYLRSAVKISAMQAQAGSSIISCPCQLSDVPMEPAATRPVVRVLQHMARLKIVQLGLEYPVVESPGASDRIWRRIWQDYMLLHEGPGCSSTRPYEERHKTSRSMKGL